MIDRHSMEKIIDGLWSEALKSAARDHLASQAAGPRPKRRKLWWLAAKFWAPATIKATSPWSPLSVRRPAP